MESVIRRVQEDIELRFYLWSIGETRLMVLDDEVVGEIVESEKEAVGGGRY